jgi:signal transduction histidine kinase
MSWVPPTRTDLALAAVATLFGLVSVLFTHPAQSTGVTRDAGVVGVLLAVMATAPLALRRSAPLPVVGLTSVGIVLAAAWGYPLAAAGLGPALAATSAAYLTDRRGAIVAGTTFAVAGVVATDVALSGEPGEGVQVASIVIIAVLATLTGDVLRTLHQRNRELDELRAVEARQAVAQERVRIARDVHDVVGHALAGIALQARAGRRLLDREPARAGEALRTIDQLATQALGETREAIGRVREPGDQAELRPQPRLDDLDELVARLQEDDLRVELRRDGAVDGVPDLVQTAAYRIVQEALSNVVKHARPATAVVRVTVDGGAVALDVRDDGRGAAGSGSGSGDGGYGLAGMRERAAQCGGTVQAGPDPAGGWRVRALLPAQRRPT